MSYIQVYRFMDMVTLTGGLGETLFHFSHSEHVLFPPFQLLRFRVRFITQHPHVTTNAQFAVDRTLKHPLFDALLQTSTKKNGVLAEGPMLKTSVLQLFILNHSKEATNVPGTIFYSRQKK